MLPLHLLSGRGGTSLAGPVIVVGNRSWRVPAGGRTRLTLRFDGSPTPVSIDAKNEVGATYQGYAGDGDASLLGHVGGASAVRILAGDGRQLDYLELPELGPALDRLKDCATELGPLIMMGVHEEGRFADAPIPPYPRRATADLGDIITAADYPAQALAAGQEGIVRFANDIDPQGRMRCRVTSSSGWPLLDARTCELFEARAKYEHALDSDGHPTTDTRIGSYVWRLKDARGQ